MGWSLSNVAAEATFSVAAQTGAPRCMHMSPDGTRLYVASDAGFVHEYALADAWDLTTGSYTGRTLNMSALEAPLYGLCFSDDGTKMFTIGASDMVRRFNLSTAWDVTTATLAGSYSVAGLESDPRGVWVRPDGTSFYIAGAATKYIRAYTMSTAWDVTTASFLTLLNVSAEMTVPRELVFKADGTKIAVANNTGKVFLYSLLTAWSISGTSSTVESTTLATDTQRGGMHLSPDGTRLYVTSDTDDNVQSYILNRDPNAPTLLTPPDGGSVQVDASYSFDWDFSDPDEGDSQTEYEFRYRVEGAATWTTVSAVTSATVRSVAAGTFTATQTYEWQIRTADAFGYWGPWSASSYFLAAEKPPAPTIDAPADLETVGVEEYTVEWSTATQDKYELVVREDDGGAPDTSGSVYYTGIVNSAATRTHDVPFPDDGVTRHVGVRTWKNGLLSDWAYVEITVDYTQPATPTVDLTAVTDGSPHIAVGATHPAPSGTEPTVTSLDVHRRETADGGEGIRVAAGLGPTATHADHTVASDVDYEYRVRAYGDNNTSVYSAWTGAASAPMVELIAPRPATVGV